MADCSKTVDFIHERERMCNFYKNCEGCPATDLVAEDTMLCAAYEDDFITDVISIVQKWSDEHPAPKPKTYADDFFEKLPKARKLVSGEPCVRACDIYSIICDHECFGVATHGHCPYWNEPYPEQEENNG